MPDSKPIKAYIRDASGELTPLAAETVYFEFPSGDSMEIAWDEPHPDDPRPPCLQLWGGIRAAQCIREDDAEMRAQVRWITILPSAANLVLVHPYPIRKRDELAADSARQADAAPDVGST
ncbi:hypothetical protein AB1286_01655 [Trinickia sp. NRRL B-1857]|uniref:hypothetical protein n=1 Tax=Trinickia sp. NRRL B-1857 TaxID=3162879 RepID=UPI003D2BC9DF